MNLSESVRMALGSLRTNKMRSALTLLGVVIGIAAVIAIMTLGQALRGSVGADLDRFGANNLAIMVEARPANAEEEAASPYSSGAAPTDPEDMISPEMLEQVVNLQRGTITDVIIGESNQYFTTVRSSNDTTTEAFTRFTNPGFITMSDYKIVAGRPLLADDIDSDRAVTILQRPVAEKLYGSPDAAIGNIVTLETESGGEAEVYVVGVYEEPKSSALVGSAPVNYTLVPYPLESAFSNDPGVGQAFTNVSLQTASGSDKKAVAAAVQSAFDALYADNPDYRVTVSDYSAELASFNQTLTIISLVIAAIGGISLVVGGIGVMNIMLITVTERTREIGVRKALGARRRDVRIQFVVEAIVVCLIGGLFGVALGAVTGMVGSQLLGHFAYPPVLAVVVSLVFALAIGLFFGYYPANKAAKLDPIEALRYE